MKAKDAAQSVTPQTTVEDIRREIPDSPNALHKRQWIANFFKHLPEEGHSRFEDLKKS